MYLIGPENTRIWSDSNRNFTLRTYARLEYGSPEIGWLLALPNPGRKPRPRPKGPLGQRLRYFLNSFRGFAAFDLRGDDAQAR